MRIGLRTGDLPEEIVSRIMQQLKGWNEDVLSLSIDWNEVAHEWKHRLLSHPAPSVRRAVAGGIWTANGKRRPGGRLGAQWENSILTCGNTHLMFDVLRSDPNVGRAWILSEARKSVDRRCKRDDGRSLSELTHEEPRDQVLKGLAEPSVDEELVSVATDGLDKKDRRELIRTIPADANPKFFHYLVGDDPELYAVLLRRREAGDAHLAPLRWPHSDGRRGSRRASVP